MAISDDLNLQKGITVTDNNMSQLASTSIQYTLARHQIKDSGDNGVQAFLETPDKKLYSLSRSGKVYLSDVETEDYLGGWSIKTEVCNGNDEECNLSWWDGRWNSSEPLEPEVIELFKNYGLPMGKNTVGCLSDNPIKYGDIENDGKKELILMDGNDWILFNPEKKRVSFYVMLNIPDWASAADTEEVLGTNEPNNPQYISQMHLDSAYESKIDSQIKDLGTRGYAKLYLGHFSDEQADDIVIWRKLYKSLLKSNPLKGFEKIRDTYIHYKLIDGEYKKQPTSSDTIKGWLAEKNLTWQKGYPSKSECPGQEGQLIPEMHDPLLNDPDVLIGLQ